MSAAIARPGCASVIVALNPHDHDFVATMDAWAVQAGAGDHEVIVVHDGCRPSLRSEYAAHRWRHPSTPVRIVESGAPGRAASNNAGVRASRGDLLVFVADDFRPSRGLVAAHRAFHALIGRPAVGVGPGYFAEALRDVPFLRWLEDTGQIFGVVFPLAGVEWSGDFYYVGNASMPRAVHDAVGGYDETYRHDLFDDWEFAQRLFAAGLAVRFVPRAIAWHDHDVTLEERALAMRRLGACVAARERAMPGPPPWVELTRLSVRDLEEDLREVRRRLDAPASIVAWRHLWSAELNLAFVRGYRDERYGSASRPVAG